MTASDERRAAIDRSSFEPAYWQLARRLREKMATGEYPPGAQGPSTPELCEIYGVARNTARQAIALLREEGVLTAERGRGTFVKPAQLCSAVFPLSDLSRQLNDPATQVKVLEARAVRASGRVARRLAVEQGARVISIKRLLTRGSDIVLYHSEYLIWDPERPLVEAELSVTALRGLFAGVGQAGIKKGGLMLHASTLTQSEAEYLREHAGALAWVIEHTFYDFDDRPISWGRFVCRSDRMVFAATVGVSGDEPPSAGGR